MALPKTETFTAANGTDLTTITGWVVNNGGFSINTNSLRSDTGGDHVAHWEGDGAFNNNQYAQALCVALVNGAYIGVAVRVHASADTYYGITWNLSTGAFFFKYVAGVYTEFGSSASFAVTDTGRLEASGTTITPKKNGSTTGAPTAVTDSAISSGYAGVGGAGDNVGSRIDDWEGGNLGGTTGDSFAAWIGKVNAQRANLLLRL